MKIIEEIFLILIFCWVTLENTLESYLRTAYYQGFHSSFYSILMLSLVTTLLLFTPVWIELLCRGEFMKYYGLKFEREMLIWIVLAVPVIVAIGFILDPTRLAPRSELEMIEKHYTGYLPSSIAKIVAEYYSPMYLLPISLIVIIPSTFIEELWFRGLIQFKISNIKTLGEASIPTAILTQSIIFGLAHIYPVALSPYLPVSKTLVFLYAMLGGIILGIVTYRFKSILPAWIIHTLGNLITVISCI
ncbi:MAG: CPBP family intramembrane glutamic endopeptidase [Candidatus Methanomethylicia archaeon]